MELLEDHELQLTARATGAGILALLALGVINAIFVSPDIDINLTASVLGTASNMLELEQAGRSRAYLSLLMFCLQCQIIICMFFVIGRKPLLINTWALFIGLGAAVLCLTGAVSAMNGAEFASQTDWAGGALQAEAIPAAALSATTDYTSFHLALVLGSLSNAAFFSGFYRTGKLPTLIAGWGIFASLLVAFVIVMRDYVPSLGNETVTAGFLAANLIAQLASGLYLSIKGVKQTPARSN